MPCPVKHAVGTFPLAVGKNSSFEPAHAYIASEVVNLLSPYCLSIVSLR